MYSKTSLRPSIPYVRQNRPPSDSNGSWTMDGDSAGKCRWTCLRASCSSRVPGSEPCMSASDIATRLGAPFEVVAQQLLDALLLPQVPDDAIESSEERPLNAGQRAAAEYNGSHYLLEAGPGTGKTRTLVGRIEFLLGQGVDPRRILVLTFSNKAAGELATRVAQLSAEAAAAIW